MRRHPTRIKQRMATVSYIMGPLGIMKLMNKVFAYNPKNKPKEHFIKEQKGSEDKQKAVVVSKLARTIFRKLPFNVKRN